MLESRPWFDDLKSSVRQILQRAEELSQSTPPDKDMRRRMRRMKGGWEIYSEESHSHSRLVRTASDEVTKAPESEALSRLMSADETVLEYYRGRISGKDGKKVDPSPEVIFRKVWGLIPFQIAYRYAELARGVAWHDNQFTEAFRDWEPRGFTGNAPAVCIAPIWNLDIGDSSDGLSLPPFRVRRIQDADADILCHAGFATRGLLSGPLSFPEVTLEYSFTHEKPNSTGVPPTVVRWLHALLRSLRAFASGCPSIEAVFEAPRTRPFGFDSCGVYPEMQGKSSLLTHRAKLKAGALDRLGRFWGFLVSSYGEMLRNLPGELGRALSRFSMSCKETVEEERLIDLVITLDALLMKDGEHDGKTLAKRGAVLIGSSGENTTAQQKLLEVAYKKRSAVVHGEAMKKIVLADKEIHVHEFNAKVEEACRQLLHRMLVLGVGKPDLRGVLDRIQRATKDGTLKERIRQESTPPWTS